VGNRGGVELTVRVRGERWAYCRVTGERCGLL
jgi:hypothetical protein